MFQFRVCGRNALRYARALFAQVAKVRRRSRLTQTHYILTVRAGWHPLPRLVVGPPFRFRSDTFVYSASFLAQTNKVVWGEWLSLGSVVAHGCSLTFLRFFYSKTHYAVHPIMTAVELFVFFSRHQKQDRITMFRALREIPRAYTYRPPLPPPPPNPRAPRHLGDGE